MKIAVFGTGVVGRNIAQKLGSLGHNVIIGTRDVAKTMASTTGDAFGSPPFGEWHHQNETIQVGSFTQAAAFGELLFNCTLGMASLEVLRQAGSENLNGKILVDVANPLDFSQGMPPTLNPVNTDSLGESIQRAFPELKVVKALNTVNCFVMVNPSLVPGDHNVFICGNDQNAKETTVALIKSFGWKGENIIDIGDISNARGTEQLLPLWIRLFIKFQSPIFNFHISRAQ